MKNKESIALHMLENQGRAIIKEQLNEFIFGQGINIYNRFSRFLEVKRLVHGWHYWYLLRTAYQSSDGLYPYREEIKEAFSRDEPEKNSLMNPYERRYLKSLDPTIKIYRGMTKAEAESGNYGSSWTLSRRKAEEYAYVYRRVQGCPEERTVKSLYVPTEEVTAYFAGPEREIIFIHTQE